MSKVAIVTDSNSGIRQEEGKKLGIYVLPMPFTIDGETFYEDINLTHSEFFDKLMSGAEVFTSQPLVGDVSKLWDDVLKEYDEIVYIPMSSGLSGSCQTAIMLANEYDEKVQVVDSQRISVTQKWDVLDAIELSKQGKSAKEIKEILEANKLNASIYITVNTLEYLRKGGRITPAVAILGGMMKIKPILQIQGEKLDTFSKSRTLSKATKIMIEAIQKDIEERLDPIEKGKNVHICIAYTYDPQPALELKEELQQLYPNSNIICDPLSLSVSCHIGPHALAIAACKKII
ncbi:DegV family protein [Thomasclavelia spiroformis]|uniref:DegV family protein n=1 Tax=Thomasclavelia spiroformis TaxID=29348 RepID=UPI00265EF38B|nr:DegV family protein [Thomasclavelia spiroformis]